MCCYVNLAAIFRGCDSRVFDYGFDGGLEEPPLVVTLPVELLLRIAGWGIDFRVSVYPFREDLAIEENQ